MTQDLHTRLVSELEPSGDALDRILARVELDLRDVDPVTAEPTRARTTRRRLPVIRIGIALAGAGAVALAIALSPFDGGSGRRGVPAPAEARAALQRAAVGAADERWRPLGAGEYFHTMSVDIAPEIPEREMDPPHLHDGSSLLGNASSVETLLDRDGHGIEIRTMGGTGDPDVFPTLTPGGGMVFRGDGRTQNSPVGTIDDQLRYAYSVSIRSWPRGARPGSTNWARQADGFVKTSEFAGGAIPKPALSLGQRFQRDLWGAPLETIDALNTAAAGDLPELLDAVLSPTPDGELAISGPLVGAPGYEETRAWFSAQVEVHNAVKLLARAPLAPTVRAALFRRLATNDHVTVERGATDRDGRTGTRITFEWLLDERVPAFTISKEELRADAIAKQQPANGTISGPDRVDVPTHRSVGRWYQSVIIEESSGTIFQNEEWADWKTTVDVPRVATTSRRPVAIDGIGWNVGITLEPGWYGTGGGELYLLRERTADHADVRSPACEITPRMCR